MLKCADKFTLSTIPAILPQVKYLNAYHFEVEVVVRHTEERKDCATLFIQSFNLSLQQLFLKIRLIQKNNNNLLPVYMFMQF